MYLRVYNDQPDYEVSEPEAFSVALVDFISCLVSSQVAVGSNVPLSSPTPKTPEFEIDETNELSDEQNLPDNNPSSPSGGKVMKEEFELIKNLQFALVALQVQVSIICFMVRYININSGFIIFLFPFPSIC